jgi:altronate dehydratase
MLPYVNDVKRENATPRNNLALQCGGSDGYSELPPILHWCGSRSAGPPGRHGHSLETRKFAGRSSFTRRALTREVAENWSTSFTGGRITKRNLMEMNNNPHRHKLGGLSTILENPGAAARGNHDVEAVYRYAEQ